MALTCEWISEWLFMPFVSSGLCVQIEVLNQIPPFSGFHISSKHQHMAEQWAWMMGETQLLSRWLWVIVNKVKLITDGWQLWSHLLPFWSPSEAVVQVPPVHMDFVSPGPSYCDNLSSGLDRMNRQSPAILFWAIHIYEVWCVCVNIRYWLCELSIQTWSPDVQLYKLKVSHYSTPSVHSLWGIGCLFALRR